MKAVDKFAQKLETLHKRVAELLQSNHESLPEQEQLTGAFDELYSALKEIEVAEQQLCQQNNERFRLLVEDVKDYAIFTLDPNGYVDSWNLGAERILGYQEAEIVGQSGSCIFTPESLQRGEDKKEQRKAVAEGRAEDERWHVRKDGTRFWASGILTSLRDEAGNLLGFSKILRDFTERKQAEEALQEANRQVTNILESITDAFISIDSEWRYQYVNPRAEQLFQKTREELIGRSMWEVFPPNPDSQYYQCAHKALAEQVTVEYEDFYPPLNIWLAVRFYPCNNGLTAYFQDITVRKQSEEALRQQAEELSQANRMKDEFLATLSHELRSPLNAILGWAHLLGSRNFDAVTSARAIETIERNAKSQLQLIEDLLDVSRIIRGQLHLNVRPLELVAVIESAVDTVRPAADAKAIQLQAVLDPMAGQISGDAERLQQVIWNLLTNAIKFTPKGGRVQICLKRTNSHVEITVSDTGQGIAADFLPHVFDRFRQADSSITRSYSGLGLGLAIVRHLVELHGGIVRAESQGEGQGATFIVQLPLLEEVRNEQVKSEDLEGPLPLTLEGLRLLVVDDNADARDLYQSLLEEYGAEVTAVASAREGIAALERLQPDVLVSDIGMPNEDGYTLIRQVRALKSERASQVPAVALTAYAREEDQQAALLAGFQKYLAKPVEPAELVEVIVNLARRTADD